QRARECGRTTEVTQLGCELSTACQALSALQGEEAFELRAAHRARAKSRRESSGPVDDAVCGERTVPIARVQPGEPAEVEVLVDERTHELVQDRAALRGGRTPKQKLASTRVIPGARCRLGERERRVFAALRQPEPCVQNRVAASERRRVVAVAGASQELVVAPGRKGRSGNPVPNLQTRQPRRTLQQPASMRRVRSPRCRCGQERTNDNCNELLHGTSYRQRRLKAGVGITPVQSSRTWPRPRIHARGPTRPPSGSVSSTRRNPSGTGSSSRRSPGSRTSRSTRPTTSRSTTTGTSASQGSIRTRAGS